MWVGILFLFKASPRSCVIESSSLSVILLALTQPPDMCDKMNPPLQILPLTDAANAEWTEIELDWKIGANPSSVVLDDLWIVVTYDREGEDRVPIVRVRGGRLCRPSISGSQSHRNVNMCFRQSCRGLLLVRSHRLKDS